MKGEIAVTRRAAYAAEEKVVKLEKTKMEQDFRCVGEWGWVGLGWRLVGWPWVGWRWVGWRWVVMGG